MAKNKIPGPVAKRLALYHRCVTRLMLDGKETVSSQDLGGKLALKASQIRKDLSYFGEFGKRGTGYNLKFLRDSLEHVLGINRTWRVAIVGAGHIGGALANHQELLKDGYEVVALFDKDPSKVNQKIGTRKIPVYSMQEIEEKIKDLSIEIGVIAVPTNEAEFVADSLVKAGVKGILNFAPVKLYSEEVELEDVDIAISFKALTFKIRSGHEQP